MCCIASPATRCLLLVRACWVSFEYLQRGKNLQNMILLFVIQYVEGTSYYISKKYVCVAFVELLFHQPMPA